MNIKENSKATAVHTGIAPFLGNNLYGEEIRQTLLGDPENRTQYILMDRILPVTSTNYMVRQEYTSIHADDVIAELGIIGILIRYAAKEPGARASGAKLK